MSDYAIVEPDDVKDEYAGTDVPGEFRRLSGALGAEQVAATLIRVPPHCDFEQGTATATRRRSTTSGTPRRTPRSAAADLRPR